MTGTQAPDTARPVPAYSWYALGILFLVYVLNFIDRQIITILAPDIKRDLGLTDADIGFLYGTAFAVFFALFGIPLGRLADGWHRVRLLTTGLAIWSAMTMVSGFARNFPMLAAARMGVGIGEATAAPSAYSLISDFFPKRLRATALAIYSAGVYVGAGVSLMLGGLIVDRWDAAYPGGGPLGLVGWHVAFMAVGAPGLLLALWVATLREPIRGLIDGLPTQPKGNPFLGFRDELFAIIPPFTLAAAASRGAKALAVNIGALALISLICWGLAAWTGAVLQWTCIGIGYYAVFSWASSLRQRDRPAFDLIWGSPAYMYTIFGYGTVSFIGYAAAAFAPVYAQEILGEDAAFVGFWIGGAAAVGGFIGIILGGRMSDWMVTRDPAGRLLVVMFGLVTPLPLLYLGYTTLPVPGTSDFFRFLVLVVTANSLSGTALGSAAAATQDLVLPRMRGTATATFLLSTTLIGLALGPYLAGHISVVTGNIGTGVIAITAIAPLGLIALIVAYRTAPGAMATLVERARASGEPI